TLRVDGGRFETPPREWELLERHRAAIETSIKAVCLFMLERDEPSASPHGLGFLIGKRTILTHQSMVPPSAETGTMRALLAFADRHSSRPPEFKERRPLAATRSDDLVVVRVKKIQKDEVTGACAIEFTTHPDAETHLPQPLNFAVVPPPD